MKFKKPKFWDYKKPTIISYLLLPISLILIILRIVINSTVKKKKYASIIMISHKSKDKNLKKCINSLSKKNFIISKPKFIRIEEI